jgi:hypothetical protein
MKKTYSLFSFLFLLMALACNKSTDLYEEVGKGAYLNLVPKGSGTGKNLDATNASSAVTLKVASYGEPVASVNVYVSSANTTDTTKWKLIKNVPFNGETDLSVTNSQIATALGLTPGNLAPGTTFHLWNQAILTDGRRFGSYNTSGPDLESQLEFNVAFHWTATVVCPYDPATAAGTYRVITDEWEDWLPGDEVEITLGPGANQLDVSQVIPGASTSTVATPLIVTVNPATGALTIPANVQYGMYGGSIPLVTGAGQTGFLFSCTGRLSIRYHIIATGYGDQGFYNIVLQKI